MAWYNPTTWFSPQDSIADDQRGDDSWSGLRGMFGADALAPSGALVTKENAMRVSAVYAAVRLISGAIASLPVHTYQRDVKGKQRFDHPLSPLMNEHPAPMFSAVTAWEFHVAQMLLRGDSYAYIARNRAGAPTALIPLNWNSVQARIEDASNPRVPSRLRYNVHLDNGYFGVQQEDMLHFPNFGFDGVNAMSIIQWGARNSIGTAISADEYAGKFYSAGTQSQFAIGYPKRMGEEQQNELRAAWEAKYTGGNSYNVPLILTEGASIENISMSAADAQLLESRQWQVIDIARAFGVPPHMIGETTKSTSFGTGIEQQGIGFVIYTLMPHIRRMQQEMTRKLFRNRRYFAEFSTNALMRGDHKSRATYYQAALGGTQAPAWMTPNEVRQLENLPPVEDGDELSKPDPSAEPAGEESRLTDEPDTASGDDE